MHFIKLLVTLSSLCAVLARPVSEREESGLIAQPAHAAPARRGPAQAKPQPKPPAKAQAKPNPPAKSTPKPKIVTVGPGGDYESRMRQQNMSPNRPKPLQCKKAQDCVAYCNGPSGKPHFSECDIAHGGWCICQDPNLEKAALAFAKPILAGMAKFADVPVVKAIMQVMKTVADIEQVAKLVLTTIAPIPAPAKKAISALFDAWQGATTGGVSSHLDDVTKGALNKVLSVV